MEEQSHAYIRDTLVCDSIGICRRWGEMAMAMADADNVLMIIRWWKCFDLTKLQKELDETASQILNRQDDSDHSRRKLVKLSREFKRTSPEDARSIVSPLLKSFQLEIDKLCKRSKAAEAAFLHIYKRIIDIIDPLPLLEKCLDIATHSNTNFSNKSHSHSTDDGNHLSDFKRGLEIESEFTDPIRDPDSSHRSGIANHELTISSVEEEENRTRLDSAEADNRKSTEAIDTAVREECDINSTTRGKALASATGSDLLLESSLVGNVQQDLQSALNQSQSREIFNANRRNEKLFYAKSISDEVIVHKSETAIMSESEKDTKNEANAAEENTDATDDVSHDDAAKGMNVMKGSQIDMKSKANRTTMDKTSKSLSSANSSSTLSSPSPSFALESGLTAKEKEISFLVDDIQRLQSTIVKLKETTAAQISQMEEILVEKNKIIKHLEEKLERKHDYDDIKRELSLLKAELSHCGASAIRDQKPFEMFLLEKTKALQSENAVLKVANAELTNSLPRHLIPPFIPPFQNLGNVETFGSMLGEEIVNSYAKAFKREIAIAVSNDQNNSNNATGTPSPPPTSNDDAKSIGSEGGTPKSSSAINCNDDPIVNNGNSPPHIEPIIINTKNSPSLGSSYDKLQQQLRLNVEKYMNETLNTLNISRCVRELLSVHNIGQRLFAKYVLGLSQGTVSELLSKPKPWDKLTEKGRDSYRKMHAWAADDKCILLLKGMVPRKGKETSTFKQDDPAAEERIAQILSEAQRAMLSPKKNGSRGAGTPLLNGDAIQIKSEKLNDTGNENQSDNGDRDDRNERRSPAIHSLTATMSNLYRSGIIDSNISRRMLRKFENDDIPQDMVSRIYQEELAKLIGQQVEEGFRHPHGMGGYERTQDEIRQALAIYHQELSRLTQMASAGGSQSSPSNSEIFARFTAASAAAAAAGLVNGANYLGLPHLIDTSLPIDARIRSEKSSNGIRESRDNFGSSSPENDMRHGSAFSLVRPKLEANSGSKTYSSSSSNAPGQNGSILNAGNNNEMNNNSEDLSSAASPLQRMQSITNSLLSQSSTPTVSAVPNRPAKAVLPPITQQQFDQYNNLNTEDIVKRVKDQLSQYSISQRLFGESVLGLSQGSVSDLLARPKPWHMLTQKGREPFIRMKMFLEDDNAIHKLVASQYKIAPEKLMRTGSFVAGGTSVPIGSLVSTASNSTSPNINSISSLPIIKSSNPKGSDISPLKGMENCRQTISPGYSDTTGHRSSTSTPEHHIHHNIIGSGGGIHSSIPSSSITRRISQHNTSNLTRSSTMASMAYIQPSVYEMAALTTDLDTQGITTKIKETLMAHNIGQKIFGEVVLGLSQGSVSELLSKPKPWHMLSIKGREPFIRMQLWLNDPHNIEKLQTLKNERREANKRRRTHVDDTMGGVKSLDNHIYNFSGSFSTSPSSVTGMPSLSSSREFGNRSAYGPPAVKKARILFSEEQKEALRIAFSMDPYPSTATIEFLANELALSVRTITNWFHNHRMRLKQITSANEENGGLNQTQLPYNLGRDGVNFDPIQFRLSLSQRMSDIRLHGGGVHSSSPSHKSKYSSFYLTSPVSSSMYANTNSCSSPGSSVHEEMGTLDLSISGQQHKKLSRHSLNDDSDASVSADESMELDLSKSSKMVGSSRRKPQIVTSSSSRRKPAQPQWVDPGLEFSGDDDDDYGDEMSDEMMDDDDDAYDLVLNRPEIINGVCVRQTEYDMMRRRRDSTDDDETVRVEPTPAIDSNFRLFKNNSSIRKDNERQNTIKRLEKSVQEDDEDWGDDDDDEDNEDNDAANVDEQSSKACRNTAEIEECV